jgi:hypothetical protein
MPASGKLFFDAQPEQAAMRDGLEHQVAFGFDGARDVAGAAGVVEDDRRASSVRGALSRVPS